MSNAEIFGIFKKAAKLTKDPNNGCHIVSAMRHFALPPRYLGRLKKGASELLESEIGRYSESLHAVPLAFSSLQLQQPTGTILDDQPHVHFDVSFKAVVFKPALGSVLKCVVNEYAGDHVSCLVHNWFNLSLPLYGPDVEKRLPRGSKVMTRVTGIRGKNGILAIQATPTEDRFADLQHAEESMEMEVDSVQRDDMLSSKDGVPGKQKHDSGIFSDPDDAAGLSRESQLSEDEHKKKKKKKKKEKREGTELAIKQEIEDSPTVFDRTDWRNDDLSASMTLDRVACGGDEMDMGNDSVDTETPKKKKKKKKRENQESNDQGIGSVFVKEEINNVEDSPQCVSSAKKKSKHKESDLPVQPITIKQEPLEVDKISHITHESDSARKKKKKKKRESDQDGQSIIIKEEVVDLVDSLPEVKEESIENEESLLDGQGKKKKKKKRKEKSEDGFQQEEVKVDIDEVVGPYGKAAEDIHRQKSNGLPDTVTIKKELIDLDASQPHIHKSKKKKRKAESAFDEDYNRTTEFDMSGTIEDHSGAPLKKKKKHKKERESL